MIAKKLENQIFGLSSLENSQTEATALAVAIKSTIFAKSYRRVDLLPDPKHKEHLLCNRTLPDHFSTIAENSILEPIC